MKKLLFSVLSVMLLSIAASAQQKAIQTVKISTPTVQCDKCEKAIQRILGFYDGIMSVKVNYKSQEKTTTVKFITDRINIETIKAAIANAGYKADEIDANPEAYNALPKCCKKPEDGGGAPKKQ